MLKVRMPGHRATPDMIDEYERKAGARIAALHEQILF